MAKSTTLYKILNFCFPVLDFTYLLQLEEYRTYRYLKLLKRFFLKRELQKHDKLVFTSHARLVIYGSILITLVPLLIALIFGNISLFLLVLFISSLGQPLYVGLTNVLLSPFYYLAKARKQKSARRIVENNFQELKVIAITGSFGKTTTKHFVYELVRHKYKTQMIPGNVNTAIGIAIWVINMLRADTQVLVVEMGAYTTGEINDSVQILNPDIAIITAFADQHLEQFGSFENLIDAKLEIWQDTGKKAFRIISEKFSKYLPELDFNYEAIDTEKGLYFNGKEINSSISNSTALEDLSLALRVAELLDIPERFVEDTLQKLEPPERRFKLASRDGFTIIDDSYNISQKSAEYALKQAKVIATQKWLKLCVITAGIPELGVENKNANFEYGRYLAKNSEKIVLLNSIFAMDIVEGVEAEDLGKTVFNATSNHDAMAKLSTKLSKDEYLILLQPELTDLYY